MNDLEIFKSVEFGEVRTVVIDSVPYFVGKDVTDCLGYADASHAILDHVDEDDRTNSKTQGQNAPEFGQRGTWLINESGVYALVFGSHLPDAKKFKKWVTSEVLPAIRKTGGYVNNDKLFIDTYLPYADESTKLIFSQTLKTVREQNETIKHQKAEIMHKEDVIIGLVEDIDLATKRQRITQIIRHGADGNYQERYALIYSEFERKYHCNLKSRTESCSIKPKIKNKMDYIDRVMNMIPQLYEITCKLFENDVDLLKAEWESIVA